jgi:hypothetical protein
MLKENVERCKTCKSWQLREGAKFGWCAEKKFMDAKHIQYGESAPEDALIYWDAKKYQAFLETGPEFGCVHHRELDGPTPEETTEFCKRIEHIWAWI